MNIETLESIIRPLKWTAIHLGRKQLLCTRCFPDQVAPPNSSLAIHFNYKVWSPHYHTLRKWDRGAWRVDHVANLLTTLGVDVQWSKSDRKRISVIIKEKPPTP